jgi:hypothetical protein
MGGGSGHGAPFSLWEAFSGFAVHNSVK